MTCIDGPPGQSVTCTAATREPDRRAGGSWRGRCVMRGCHHAEGLVSHIDAARSARDAHEGGGDRSDRHPGEMHPYRDCDDPERPNVPDLLPATGGKGRVWDRLNWIPADEVEFTPT